MISRGPGIGLGLLWAGVLLNRVRSAAGDTVADP